ncbi:MAG: hypothetical protein GC179_18000 [Anaerolineaceae bacterium]|nr:hypothetical protein [Anaerolineaceae bacterium]
MNYTSMRIVASKLDDWRVKQHFKYVDVILRNRDVSHLSPQLQQAREHYLNHLHAYAERGIFPRNHEYRGFSPCFIDRDGRECAVANLLMVSGHNETAQQIAATANYAYVPQMHFSELEDWSRQSGLSKEELALIQPGYYLTVDGTFLNLLLVSWATGLIALLLNAVQLIRRRKGGFIAGLGLILAIPSLLVAVLCFSNAWHASQLSINPDYYAHDLALQDVGPLMLATLISLGIALITAGLSIYRIRSFIKSIPNQEYSEKQG